MGYFLAIIDANADEKREPVRRTALHVGEKNRQRPPDCIVRSIGIGFHSIYVLRMRAVVVEPDGELRGRIVDALAARGWTVLTACGYRDGLALMRRARAIAALCVAERLARLTGPDLLAALEREPKLARVPAVLRVGNDGSLIARALRLVGAIVVVAADAEAIADAVVRAAALRDAPKTPPAKTLAPPERRPARPAASGAGWSKPRRWWRLRPYAT
jgi:hypothetical protein